MGWAPAGPGGGVKGPLGEWRSCPAGGKVLHGVRAVMYGVMEFFQLLVNVGGGGGVPDVGVDFAFEGDADAHGLEIAMMDVGGNNSAAAGDFAAHEFGVELLALGDILHFLGDDALTGKVHLREGAVA